MDDNYFKQNKNLKVNFLRSNKKKTRNGRKFLENQNKKNNIKYYVLVLVH